MTLGLEDQNAYTVEFILNVTNYIMEKRPLLLSNSWSKIIFKVSVKFS